MKQKNKLEEMISQNKEKIAKNEAQIKKLKAENKELNAKNKQLQDELLLYNVKSQIGGNDINKLLMISKLMAENGLTEGDLKELFSKGDVKIED
ncbi:MAG: hypothetical protein J6A30_08620 [Ruminococcus sp.]|nr:hypothetical protein [Ruminococcus sp.]MBR6622554.1 hypothetical protein [Ruminococcus sp.]